MPSESGTIWIGKSDRKSHTGLRRSRIVTQKRKVTSQCLMGLLADGRMRFCLQEGGKSKCKKGIFFFFLPLLSWACVSQRDGGHGNRGCASCGGNCYFTPKRPPSRAAAENRERGGDLTGWKIRSREDLKGRAGARRDEWRRK